MKKTVLISLMAAAVTAGASAQSWATKWDWPIQPIHQQFNVGETEAAGMDVGGAGIYWDVLSHIDSPFVREAILAEMAKNRTAAKTEDKAAAPAPKS